MIPVIQATEPRASLAAIEQNQTVAGTLAVLRNRTQGNYRGSLHIQKFVLKKKVNCTIITFLEHKQDLSNFLLTSV
jgi:hypothetical protein